MFGKIIEINILNHLTAVIPSYLLVACKNMWWGSMYRKKDVIKTLSIPQIHVMLLEIIV